ncbi:MAG: protein-glutamate O-methyltransferase CheR [Candidatus Aminicenantes bacterium]|nr:protein-glutamate O-methyltransferase CheR [Candidatus Aminicenantes bacterium]NIM80369.1 protein-glutamate O-methyltransferase CheR [Candidatus Aminicenantes bacterium]NIN19756.1 protein-glutamate O-methyltransferase CheR [Candidatus Aminicenantes bacterium]NIN43638.1 protein-glutamate O-methyltransferase CheR [Candidatus Aminicenantes bacterium]NIN86383.1 protein-glutamate O-methyltransferase CheR [Candidatus Aminicenantes bacterium]
MRIRQQKENQKKNHTPPPDRILDSGWRKENEKIELDLLLEAIYQKYHYDFKEYSRAHIKRRFMYRMRIAKLKNLSEMQHKILYNQSFFETLLMDLSINVTEMFRDPSFYLALRKKIIPHLKKYPFIKIWHAGCASGEEVYSMAILLKEEGLLEKTQIYATDFNALVLKRAKDGIFPIDLIKEYTSNYQKAGGANSFADYYTAHFDSVILNSSLKDRIVFADHNLVTDGVFGEMNLIVCRNVLIYFTKKLQNRVVKLFLDSLASAGFLCLGSKESLQFSEYANQFKVFVAKEKIYQRKPGYGEHQEGKV